LTTKGLAIGLVAGVVCALVVLYIGLLGMANFGDRFPGYPLAQTGGDDPQVTPGGDPLVRHIEIKDQAGETRATVSVTIEAHPRFSNGPGWLTLVSLTTEDGTQLPIETPKPRAVPVYTSPAWSFSCGPNETCVRRFVATWEVNGPAPFRAFIGVGARVDEPPPFVRGNPHQLTVTIEE
jgi:hypothetical protein